MQPSKTVIRIGTGYVERGLDVGLWGRDDWCVSHCEGDIPGSLYNAKRCERSAVVCGQRPA